MLNLAFFAALTLLAFSGCGVRAQGLAPASAAAPASLADIRIHVAPQGDDRWTGAAATPDAARNDGPVKTLARAQQLARAQTLAMGSAQPRLPVRVVIAPGTYYLLAPLVFTPADSGTAAAPVSYEAARTGTVTLSGGVPLVPHITTAKVAFASFDLPDAGKPSLRGGGQLIVNGHRATLARQPKAGQYWFVQRVVPLASEPDAQTGYEAFIPSNEAGTWLAGLSPADRSRAIVQVMHSWTSSHHRLSDASTPGDAVRLTPRARWAFLSTGSSQRYFVENVESALTDGGEWITTDSEVRYLPTAAQAGRALDVVLPVLERLVVIQGDARAGKPVQHLQFRNLAFSHTRHLTAEGGFLDRQAAIEVGAAFEVDDAQHITIDGCSFSQTAGYGVWLRRSVTDSRVLTSTFDDMGAGGIQIGVAREAAGQPQTTSRNRIENNRIGNTGVLFPGAVGVWLAQGYDNIVAHNLIHDTSYTGISVGWSWNFKPAGSGRHRITDNLLVNIGQSQMSDMGGIYTLGVLTGTVVAGNVIREVHAYPGYGPGRGLGAWGIYNDLGSSELIVENNVVVGTDSGGYHLNGGRNIMVRNNVFAGSARGEVRVSRKGESTPQAALEDNLIFAATAQAFEGLAGSPELAFAGNQVSGAGADAPDLRKCGAGCAVSKAAVRTTADGKGISLQGVDATSNARWARVVAEAGPSAITGAGAAISARSQRLAVPMATPLALKIDLRASLAGALPLGLSYSPKGDIQAFKVIDSAAAPGGGRCLQFNDNAGFTHRFDPHAYATLNHEAGSSVASFSILIDNDTSFVHEWRDDDRPYLTGPSLRISAAGVVVAGKVVAPVSAGQWMTFRVTSPLGKPGSAWQLEMRDAAGMLTRVQKLRPVSPAWQTLNYVGYISDAATTSTMCLADVTVMNSTGQ